MRNMGGLRKHIPMTYWAMTIGTLALTGVGIPFTMIGTAGFFSKDAIIEASFAARHCGLSTFAFGMLVIAALFTSFYSWRLAFMTFFGKPRASHEVMHHVHESPQVMLVPLYVLTRRRICLLAILFHGYFFGEEYAEFWKGALFTLPRTTRCCMKYDHVPTWVKLSPFVAMLHRSCDSLVHVYQLAGNAGKAGREHNGCSTSSCSTNGISTNCTTSCSYVPRRRLASSCGRRAMLPSLMAMVRMVLRHGVVGVTGRVVRLQSGYLYHYAFAMLIGDRSACYLDDAREFHSDDRLANSLNGHLFASGRRRPVLLIR